MTLLQIAPILCAWITACVFSQEVRRRTLNLLIALDQLAYVLLTLGAGHPDETLSAAAWRTERKNRLLGIAFRPVIDLLFRPLERDHCRKAYESEKYGRQLPKEYQA